MMQHLELRVEHSLRIYCAQFSDGTSLELPANDDDEVNNACVAMGLTPIRIFLLSPEQMEVA